MRSRVSVGRFAILQTRRYERTNVSAGETPQWVATIDEQAELETGGIIVERALAGVISIGLVAIMGAVSADAA